MPARAINPPGLGVKPHRELPSLQLNLSSGWHRRRRPSPAVHLDWNTSHRSTSCLCTSKSSCGKVIYIATCSYLMTAGFCGCNIMQLIELVCCWVLLRALCSEYDLLSPAVTTGWEAENTFRVRNTLGQDVYFARESTCTEYWYWLWPIVGRSQGKRLERWMTAQRLTSFSLLGHIGCLCPSMIVCIIVQGCV